jgi:two-component system response regulator HydG
MRFLEEMASAAQEPWRLTPGAAAKLVAYRWPGNVRELHNCLEHAAALAPGSVIDLDHLPERILRFEADDFLVTARDQAELPSLDEVERRYILRVLDVTGGQRKVAARILGVDRKTLYRKLERYRHQGYLEDDDTEDL